MERGSPSGCPRPVAGPAVAILLGLLGALAWCGPAAATPLYAVRSAHACDTCHVEPAGWAEGALPDRRCTLDCTGCHVSPAGGGMRKPAGTFYGRQVLPTIGKRPAPEGPGGGRFRISEGFSGWQPGDTPLADVPNPYGTIDRDPRFDYGLDFRSALFAPLEAGDRDLASFPMQADFYLMGRFLDRLVLYGNAGLMGSRKRTYEDLDGRTGFQQLVAAREVFAMVDRLPYGGYVRAGRIAPAYGWHLPDHTSFVRRDLGFDQNQQVFGVEGGANPVYPYLKVALFYQGWDGWPGDVQPEGTGFSATAGYRDLAGQVGASVHGVHRFDGPEELTCGLNWGLNLYPLVYLGEFDVQRRSAEEGENGDGGRTSLFTYHELNWLIARGLSAMVKYDGMDLDTRDGGDRYHRGTVGAQWNPYTYLQLDLQYRRTFLPGETDEQDLLAMFHAYL